MCPLNKHFFLLRKIGKKKKKNEELPLKYFNQEKGKKLRFTNNNIKTNQELIIFFEKKNHKYILQ